MPIYPTYPPLEIIQQCAYCQRIKKELWVEEDISDVPENLIKGCICRDCMIEELRQLTLRAKKAQLQDSVDFVEEKVDLFNFEQYNKSTGERKAQEISR